MNASIFDERIKGQLGFGCMRMKMQGDEIDLPYLCRQVDHFMENGFNYFDTAYGYMKEMSEAALREALVKRYSRESFVICDKLTTDYFEKEEDIRPFFEKQLANLGVEHIDVYLMHAQNARYYEKYKACRAYETAFELKKEGKVGHVGLSYHDRAELLDQILTDYPDLEVVQLQYNYADYDDAGIEAKKCYEVCVKHGKYVIVMEPIKGGTLAELPPDAAAVFDEIGRTGSNASYALRFAASAENVIMVLSGMTMHEQLVENVNIMKDFQPLSENEKAAIDRVLAILKTKQMIPCTACGYCLPHCPKAIDIPALFSDLNAKKIYNDWNSSWYYKIHTMNGGRASDCIRCGKCEKACPQHLPIRQHLEEVAKRFDHKKHG